MIEKEKVLEGTAEESTQENTTAETEETLVFKDQLLITQYETKFDIKRYDEEGNLVEDLNPIFDMSVEDLLKGAIDVISKKRFEQMVQSINGLHTDLSGIVNFLMSMQNAQNPEGEDTPEENKVEIPE